MPLIRTRHKSHHPTEFLSSVVPAPALEDGAVTEPKIGASAVTAPKLADGAATYAKLGTGAIRGTPAEPAKDIRDGVVSLTGPGPHDIATGLAAVDYAAGAPTDALLAYRVAWAGSTVTIETNATPTQAYSFGWMAKGSA